MTSEKRDFNKDASTWDENPGRIKMADSVFTAIKNSVNLRSDMDVFDFGCGTGLLSLRILPHVHSVTGADSSTGMLEVLNSKIISQRLTLIRTFLIDIDNDETLSGNYDLVTCSMTMHHIKNPAPLIKQFYNIIKPGGYLCIADLDSDNGKFHDDSTGVFHNGFPREEMKNLFINSGFAYKSESTAAEISKPDSDGNINKFSVFLITGIKT